MNQFSILPVEISIGFLSKLLVSLLKEKRRFSGHIALKVGLSRVTGIISDGGQIWNWIKDA